MKKELLFMFLTFLIVFLLLPSVFAIGVSPAKVEFEYSPNFDAEVEFIVKPSSNSQPYADIALSGDLAQFAQIDTDRLTLANERVFKVKLKIPNDHELVGKQVLWVRIQESAPKNAGLIAVTTAVAPAIVVLFPYPGKYVEISKLSVSNVNEGENGVLEWAVISRGTQDVIFSSNTKVIDPDNVSSLEKNYDPKVLLPLESYDYSGVLKTKDLKPGQHSAELDVYFDGKHVKKSVTFFVGEKDVELVRYYPVNLTIDEISEISFTIKNLWNGLFQNVYAEISLNGTTAITPSGNIGAFEELTLKQFLDLRGKPVGTYEGTFIVFFEDTKKEFPFTINLIAPPEPEEVTKEGLSSLAIMMIVVIVLLVIMLVLFFFVFKNKNNKK